MHAAAGLVRASASIVEVEEELMEIVLPPVEQTQNYKDVTICDDRAETKQDEIHELMLEYADVLNDLPGRTTLLEHAVKLTSTDLVRSKAYPVPHSMQQTIKDEIEAMINLGIIGYLCLANCNCQKGGW